MRGALACLDDCEVRAHKDLELLVGGGPSSVQQVRIGHASASGLSDRPTVPTAALSSSIACSRSSTIMPTWNNGSTEATRRPAEPDWPPCRMQAPGSEGSR